MIAYTLTERGERDRGEIARERARSTPRALNLNFTVKQNEKKNFK